MDWISRADRFDDATIFGGAAAAAGSRSDRPFDRGPARAWDRGRRSHRGHRRGTQPPSRCCQGRFHTIRGSLSPRTPSQRPLVSGGDCREGSRPDASASLYGPFDEAFRTKYFVIRGDEPKGWLARAGGKQSRLARMGGTVWRSPGAHLGCTWGAQCAPKCAPNSSRQRTPTAPAQ